MFPSTSDEGGTTKTKRYERIRSSSELNTTVFLGKGEREQLTPDCNVPNLTICLALCIDPL